MKRSSLIGAYALATIGMAAQAGSIDGDAVLGGMLGGGAGAAVGSAVGGREGAILGGAIGGAAGAAIATDRPEHDSGPIYRERKVIRVHEPSHHHDNGLHLGHHKRRH
jgi:hypothetical protein